MEHPYLDKVMRYLPKYLNAEICSTGGGYYSICIPFDQYSLEIPDEGGGAMLYTNDGYFVAVVCVENNPRKLAQFVTKFHSWNFNTPKGE